MVGKDLCVHIELDGGGKRYISGLVTAARVAGHQGRSVVYELRLEPWLKILTHTSDYKAFQNKNVVDIWMRYWMSITASGKTAGGKLSDSRPAGAVR